MIFGYPFVFKSETLKDDKLEFLCALVEFASW